MRARVEKVDVLGWTKSYSETWVSFEAVIFFNLNMKKRASELVCVMKDTVCTHGVKSDRETAKEFGIE